MRKVAVLILAAFVLLAPLAGTAGALQWNYKNFLKQSLAWYYMYRSDDQKFNGLYNLSVQANVSNKTLELAMDLYINASREYNESMQYGIPTDYRDFGWMIFGIHIRKAYLYIEAAINMLRTALQERGINWTKTFGF